MNKNDTITINDVSIVIASDHAGFEQKEKLVPWLKKRGCLVLDLGPENQESVDYPEFAAKVAQEVVSKGVSDKTTFGVLVCGTGIGMAIAANKIRGVRAANITTPKFAVLAREHNDANVITLSGRLVGLQTNKKILEAFLTTRYKKGRHELRLEQIEQIELMNA